MSERKLKARDISQKDDITRLLGILPENVQKEVKKYYLRIPKTRNLTEKRVYKARLLNILCEWVSKNMKEKKKELCKEIRDLVRKL